ncbi:hypothetical protein TRFO_18458 [Tritrichomonas foetus]|uniref:Prominin n=1 Tax=Tritrichomonas foetus TaxID=1144522 RepID=A0A1J4KQC0_9EUKA|nr:hypothetical protein TRFO_18458 [Tritrichomonas foetus]|eukprot:OHT11886.1 hypothetical protein TRFO_18458 [Tritrichomonas foetus]
MIIPPYIYFFFVFTVSASDTYPQTKNPVGGIFNWANVLDLQRKAWNDKGVAGQVQFYSGQPDIEPFLDSIFDKISVNVTKEIEKLFNKIEGNDNSAKLLLKLNNKDLVDKSRDQIQFPGFLSLMKKKLMNKLNPQIFSQEFINYKLYKTIFGSEFDKDKLKFTTDAQANKFLGQVYSSITVITLITCFFLLSFLFYFFFMFGCCCCCKAKDEFRPGIASIIFYVIAVLLMLIGTIFSFISFVYITKIINFVFNDFKDYTTNTIDSLKSNINNLDSSIETNVSPIIQSMMNNLTVLGNYAATTQAGTFQSNLTFIVDNMTNLFYFYDKVVLENSDNMDKMRLDLSSTCRDNVFQMVPNPISETVKEFVEEIRDNYDTLVSSKEQVDDLIDSPKSITNSLSDLLNDLKEFTDDPGINDKLDIDDLLPSDTIDEIQEVIDDIKDYQISIFKVVPTVKAALYLPSILMLVLIVVQGGCFWCKNCCSRCIASCACCFPCCCNLCNFLTGAVFSLLGFLVVIVFEIIIDSGNASFNKWIGNTFTNNQLLIPSIDLNKVQSSFHGEVSFDPIQITTMDFIKHLLDAKTSSSLLEFLGLNILLPSNTVKTVLNKATNNLNITMEAGFDDSQIQEILDKLKDPDTVPSSFDKIFGENIDINQMNDDLSQALEASKTSPQCSSDILIINNYISYFDNYKNGLSNMEIYYNNFAAQSQEIYLENPKELIKHIVNTVMTNILTIAGNGIGDVLTSIYQVLDDFNAESIIGFINLFRTLLLYNITAFSICWSIASHLFLVGMFVMVINMCIRRRGMGPPAEKSDTYSSDYSYDGRSSTSKSTSSQSISSSVSKSSYSQEKNQKNNKKDKKGNKKDNKSTKSNKKNKYNSDYSSSSDSSKKKEYPAVKRRDSSSDRLYKFSSDDNNDEKNAYVF